MKSVIKRLVTLGSHCGAIQNSNDAGYILCLKLQKIIGKKKMPP